ncbi:MAG: hypothetical protein D6725_05420 [Planctomycetota bacterium]|nr:MAG: hypothetical protein D6725_05420 [Planctomycetota bacterium]
MSQWLTRTEIEALLGALSESSPGRHGDPSDRGDDSDPSVRSDTLAAPREAKDHWRTVEADGGARKAAELPEQVGEGLKWAVWSWAGTAGAELSEVEVHPVDRNEFVQWLNEFQGRERARLRSVPPRRWVWLTGEPHGGDALGDANGRHGVSDVGGTACVCLGISVATAGALLRLVLGIPEGSVAPGDALTVAERGAAVAAACELLRSVVSALQCARNTQDGKTPPSMNEVDAAVEPIEASHNGMRSFADIAPEVCCREADVDAVIAALSADPAWVAQVDVAASGCVLQFVVAGGRGIGGCEA